MAEIDFRALFEHSPNAYMLLDRELRYVAANAAYLRATSSQLEDLLGKQVFEAFPNDPEDPKNESALQLRQSFERVLATRRSDTIALIAYCTPVETPAGVVLQENYWSATHTPLLGDDGEVAYILQHTVNVTEVEQLKQAVRAAAAGDDLRHQVQAGVLSRAKVVQDANLSLDAERMHLRRLFDQAPGFVCVLRGPELVVELANRAYYDLIGGRPIVGRPIREALREIDGQGYFELLDRVYGSGQPFVGKCFPAMVARKPGAPLEERWIDFVYQPITGTDGAVTGIFVQGNDVTEQKLAQDELARYREHLEELVRDRTRALEESEAERRQAQAELQRAMRMESIGKLTGGVAHDFNNLLQVIGGNLQMLLRDVADDERATRRVRTAAGAVDRGAKLASQLLAFARRQPIEPVVINLGKLLYDVDDLLCRALGEKVKVRLHVEKALWNSLADPTQMENVILNLAINARDAMDGEGELTIETRNAFLDDHYVSLHPDVVEGEYVMLAVSDTGSGMPPEVMERAFDPFFTTKPEGQGTGLGLSMVYGLVKQSGGHIKIYSEVGHGTTIRIYLPREHRAESRREEIANTAVVGGSETILVAEDDPAVRATAVEMLGELGYRVLEAGDAASALALIEGGAQVDVLFSDVVMPGPLSSPELARRAKALLPGLEVLFASGYAENAIVHGGRIDPGVRLLSKPYRREDLARRLRHMLRNRAQRAATMARAAAKGAGGLRILLVDDDPEIRESVADVLGEELGHELQAVASAEEALAAMEGQTFDILFTDVGLPGMSGLELARRAMARRPALRVILATGLCEEKLPGAVLLPKPYDLARIRKALEQAVARRASSTATARA